MIDVEKLILAITQEDEELAGQELENCLTAAADKVSYVLSGEKLMALPILVAAMEVVVEKLKPKFDNQDKALYRFAKGAIECCSFEVTKK